MMSALGRSVCDTYIHTHTQTIPPDERAGAARAHNSTHPPPHHRAGHNSRNGYWHPATSPMLFSEIQPIYMHTHTHTRTHTHTNTHIHTHTHTRTQYIEIEIRPGCVPCAVCARACEEEEEDACVRPTISPSLPLSSPTPFPPTLSCPPLRRAATSAGCAFSTALSSLAFCCAISLYGYILCI